MTMSWKPYIVCVLPSLVAVYNVDKRPQYVLFLVFEIRILRRISPSLAFPVCNTSCNDKCQHENNLVQCKSQIQNEAGVSGEVMYKTDDGNNERGKEYNKSGIEITGVFSSGV